MTDEIKKNILDKTCCKTRRTKVNVRRVICSWASASRPTLKTTRGNVGLGEGKMIKSRAVNRSCASLVFLIMLGGCQAMEMAETRDVETEPVVKALNGR